MPRTETRRVDISCTRDKNVLVERGAGMKMDRRETGNPRTRRRTYLTRDICECERALFENVRTTEKDLLYADAFRGYAGVLPV